MYIALDDSAKLQPIFMPAVLATFLIGLLPIPFTFVRRFRRIRAAQARAQEKTESDSVELMGVVNDTRRNRVAPSDTDESDSDDISV